MNIEELKQRKKELAKELEIISRKIANVDAEDKSTNLSLYHHRKNKDEIYYMINFDGSVKEEEEENVHSLDLTHYNAMNYFNNRRDTLNTSKYLQLVIKVFKALSFSNGYEDFDKSGFKHVISITNPGLGDSEKPAVHSHYDLDYQILSFRNSESLCMFRKLITDDEIISFYLGLLITNEGNADE